MFGLLRLLNLILFAYECNITEYDIVHNKPYMVDSARTIIRFA